MPVMSSDFLVKLMEEDYQGGQPASPGSPRKWSLKCVQIFVLVLFYAILIILCMCSCGLTVHKLVYRM